MKVFLDSSWLFKSGWDGRVGVREEEIGLRRL